jgi:hypothetical protein
MLVLEKYRGSRAPKNSVSKADCCILVAAVHMGPLQEC